MSEKKIVIDRETAIIINPRFQERRISFSCADCDKLTIFTNEFIKYNDYRRMICECGSISFRVNSFDKYE